MSSSVGSPSSSVNLQQAYQQIANAAQSNTTAQSATALVQSAEQAYVNANPNATVGQFEQSMQQSLGTNSAAAQAAVKLTNAVANQVLPTGDEPTASTALSSIDGSSPSASAQTSGAHRGSGSEKAGGGGGGSSASSSTETVWDPSSQSWIQQPSTSG